MKKQAEQTKSIFILEVYEFAPCERPAYQLHKERYCQCAGPCFLTWKRGVGYFETLRDAEKCIKEMAEEMLVEIYGFVVKEMPQNHLVNIFDCKVRRYLKDGSPWRAVSGKNPVFKEGDFVEIPYDEHSELGIVLSFEKSDNAYFVVTYNVLDEESDKYHTVYCNAVDLLPPSFPVQKKYAAALRRGLKQAEKESIDDLPF